MFNVWEEYRYCNVYVMATSRRIFRLLKNFAHIVKKYFFVTKVENVSFKAASKHSVLLLYILLCWKWKFLIGMYLFLTLIKFII